MTGNQRIRNSLLLLLFCVVGMPERTSADLVTVEYFDRASNPAFGGPLWTGVIDTVTDKLRIDTWTELPRHSDPDFWVPADLPLVWNAVDGNGNPFDVTNANLFDGNGQINFGSDAPANAANDFAFISPQSMQSMNWHPFDTNTGAPDTNTIVQYTDDVIYFPGWGGEAFVSPVNGLTFRINQPSSSSNIDYDYRAMPALPNNPEGLGTASAATVTVVRIEETSAAVIGVPEASAFLGVGLIAAVSAANAMRRKNLRRS